ncbi:MAG: TonB-dependent receptor [Acidobacteria bacterium]|nr:TonB-dependent receptor [Acidobacteriota bacterium]
MRSRLVWMFAIAALVAAPLSGWAQQTTGSLRGTVTDESGAVLPGVTVTLRGQAVPGTPTSITNEQGIYRFPNLPPGSYAITVELAGFATSAQTGIAVGLGSSVDLPVQLKVSTQQETITVTAEAPVVDSASTQVATNYSREWVANAPVRRFTFFDLINAAPGVSPSTATSSRSQSFGSATNENMYLLDGTDFTAPLTGAAWPWPNTDAIEEIQVLSLGAPADYGNLAGAVFNVVTRQGSNQFKGDLNFYFQNQSLTGRNTTTDQDGDQPYNRDEFKDMTVQLGGPAVKDKLWFFGSFQYQKDADSQPGTPKEFPAISTAKRYFWKLNYQINQNNRLQAQMHDDFYRIPGRASATTAPSTIGVENGHNPSPGFLWSSVLTPTTVLEARYSGFYGVDHGDPLDGGPRVARHYYDLDTGNQTGGIYLWYDGKSAKTAFSGKVTKYADDFMGGSHDFKVGVQFNSGRGEYTYGNNDYIYTYGSEPAYGYTQLPFTQGGRLRALGVFADDTYKLGRATINVGVRYDDSKAYFAEQDILDRNGDPTGQKSRAVDEVFRWKAISPRFGVNVKLNESGSTLLKGHYGRYYRGIVTGEFDNTTPSIAPRYLFSGNYDAAGNPLDLELVSDTSQLAVDPNLKNPYTDQFIVAVEQQVGPDIGFSVNYVHKESKRQTAFPDVGGTYDLVNYAAPAGANVPQVYRLLSGADSRLFQLSNDGRMNSKYNGVAFELKKRMSHRWQANFGLTLSKSTGRQGSSSARSTPLSSQTSTAGIFGQNPNDFINSDGRLIGDRPVVLKTQLIFQLPYGITSSFNFASQSGKPIYSEIRVPSSVTGIPGTNRVIANQSDGSDRTKQWTTIDSRLEKSFNLGGTTELAVFGDFLNLTNSDANESVLDRRLGNSNYFVPSRFILPRRVMIGGKFRF